ncbi:hypothetical protein LC608_34450 [Nostoc sp. XA010]|nr:hypothetical protein [Nostoc sp. XA010]
MQSQFFTANVWATFNCLPAAPPKQKKGIWGMGNEGRGLSHFQGSHLSSAATIAYSNFRLIPQPTLNTLLESQN